MSNIILEQLKEFNEQYSYTKKQYKRLAELKVNFINKLEEMDLEFTKDKAHATLLTLLGVALTPVLVGLIILPFGIRELRKCKKTEAENEKAKSKLYDECKQEREKIIEYLQQQYVRLEPVVKFEYASPFIVERLISYIEMDEANTITKAIDNYDLNAEINYNDRNSILEMSRSLGIITEIKVRLEYDTFINNINRIF